MNYRHNSDEITLFLIQTLTGYDVIPANFGWHIHKGDDYYGLLEYQETKGWQGDAFNHLPLEFKEQLKSFGQPSYSLSKLAA
ncbi:MAG: hypothetical protein JOZ78_08200 [Chroococcidiopsidaceae cyanobacterium CP_BM_ER_R8_30]|nr:hypothetical protein [Chroococcidiopsidaceae cyanobacterium CP_BM_ER_R8_30]